MQARTVVIAIQVGVLEREVRERMRTIHDDLDAAGAGHVDDLADGEDLTRQVGHVAAVDDLRARPDGLLVTLAAGGAFRV